MKARGRGSVVRDRGVGEDEGALAGSEAEGFYGLLRGVTSHSHPLPSQPPLKRSFLTPSSTAPQLPLQESTGPEASVPAGQATVSTSPAATSRGGHTSPYATS